MTLEKSNIGSTGLNRKPEKQNPRRFNADSTKHNLVMSESQKEEENFYLLKKLILDYEEIGRKTIYFNKDRIIKNFNLANGIIDPKDYVKTEAEYASELQMVDGDNLDIDLKFYPLIPKIVNTLTAFLSKTKISYSAIAVNREAVNEILEKKNQEIRNLVVGSAMEIFNSDLEDQGVTSETQPDVYQKQLEIFQNLPKIQKYYNSDYRLSVEQWANHAITNSRRKFRFPEIERELFQNKIISDRPYLHLNLMDESIKPEVIKPEDAAYLKSPYNSDVSEGYMFMWYEYHSPVALIQNFGDKMSEDDVDKLKQRFLPTRFTATTAANYQFETQKPVEADIQNILAFKSDRDDFNTKYRGEEYHDNLIQVMNMYVLVPRKIIKVTLKTPEEEPTTFLVDETYKPVFKPVYVQGKPKTEQFLIEGEHLEPMYINELWRTIKINFSRNPNPNLNHDIWVMLEKYPVQLSDPKLGRFGSYLPIHGGPTTNKRSVSNQIVDKAAVWQVIYNYLWNRIYQILETEIGSFFVMNQNAIPTESMDGSWGKHNVLKFMLTARDVGLAPVDTSPQNMPGGNQLTGGFGQKVDLNRTSELLEKVQLTLAIKEECYSVIGLSSSFISDSSPNETATGIAQGIQRSIASIKTIYDEFFGMMERSHQTLLELEKYLAIKGGTAESTYINGESERVIFQTSAKDFPLYTLGVHTSANFDDSLLLAELKEMVKRDNTMGADLAEKISMLTSDSISEVHSSLKDIVRKRQQEEQKKQDHEAQLNQAKIDAENMRLEKELMWEKEKLLLELESQENIQEMKVVGQSVFAQGGGVEELQKLEAMELDRKDYYNKVLQAAQQNQQLTAESQLDRQSSDLKSKQDADLKRQELALKYQDIQARLKISANQLAIAKENKNPKETKSK
jgi:hypothetical protein